jgi:hypothetical protein
MALWKPSLIESALWLKASVADSFILTDTDRVRVWLENKRKSPVVATQDPSSAGCTKSGNTVVLTTAADLKLVPHVPLTEGMAIFVVHDRTINTRQITVGGTSAYGLFWDTDNVCYSKFSSSSFQTHGAANTLTGTIVSCLTRDATHATLWLNGTMQGTPQTVTGVSSLFLEKVGRTNNTTAEGTYREILILNQNPSTELRQTIEGYLAHEHGVTAGLPSGHPYKTDPPLGVSLYGTARDKTGALVASRKVVAIRESDNVLVASGVTDANGEYDLLAGSDGAHTLVFSGEPDRNALVFRGVTPDEAT